MRAAKVELDYVRNPPGFNNFIDKLSKFQDVTDELEASNIEKWAGLEAMDNYLMNTYSKKVDEESTKVKTYTMTKKVSKKKSSQRTASAAAG